MASKTKWLCLTDTCTSTTSSLWSRSLSLIFPSWSGCELCMHLRPHNHSGPYRVACLVMTTRPFWNESKKDECVGKCVLCLCSGLFWEESFSKGCFDPVNPDILKKNNECFCLYLNYHKKFKGAICTSMCWVKIGWHFFVFQMEDSGGRRQMAGWVWGLK